MALEIIGAGFGRTGTLSLKQALETLGFDKCYHMEEVGYHPEHVPLWIAAAEGQPVDWDALFTGYKAAVDFPPAPFYRELLAHYPDAKVILTIRDPERWYESAAATIFRMPPRPLLWLLQLFAPFNHSFKMLKSIMPVARKTVHEYTFQNDLSKAHLIDVFNQHNAAVQQTVPPERLLVFEVKQGWQPLCDFLGVPVPAEPFPHTNTRETFRRRRIGRNSNKGS